MQKVVASAAVVRSRWRLLRRHAQDRQRTTSELVRLAVDRNRDVFASGQPIAETRGAVVRCGAVSVRRQSSVRTAIDVVVQLAVTVRFMVNFGPVRCRRFACPLITTGALAVFLIGIGCGGGNSATGPTPPQTPAGDPTSPGTSQVFVGAGDIAVCDALDPARQTGQLLTTIGGTVFTLGDNAYFGSTPAYRDCYDPVWGRDRSRTRPVPGNEEYENGVATAAYFSYFGGNAGAPGSGYYRFTIGAWHAIALNSNLSMSENSAQGQWLKGDLATNRAKCTIAYWHHPLFSSSQNGPQSFARDAWRQLYAAGADVVLGGHDHVYERFAPQDPDGRPDSAGGIREFIVGTGGAFLYPFRNRAPNSEVQLRAFGVLKLTLDAESYEWQFIQIGGAIGDSGTGQCH